MGGRVAASRDVLNVCDVPLRLVDGHATRMARWQSHAPLLVVTVHREFPVAYNHFGSRSSAGLEGAIHEFFFSLGKDYGRSAFRVVRCVRARAKGPVLER